MPDAGILATVLLLVGLFLLGLEFFVPSFGMILTMAVLSLVVSFWSAYKAWWGQSPWFFWTYVVLLTAGVPGSLISAITLIQRTTLGNRMILSPLAPEEVSPANTVSKHVGHRGVALTLMTPGGLVLVEGDRSHAESLGMLIEANTPVIVVGTKGNRLVVRPITAADEQSALPASEIAETSVIKNSFEVTSEANAEPNPLDFDIPADYTDKS